MGAARSALRRTLKTPVQTQRQIDKVLDNQPTMAPRHDSTKDLLDMAKEENQAKFDVYNKRNEEYLSLLKQIRVDSVDVTSENNAVASKESSSSQITTEKLSAEQLTMLFQQRMTNPDKWNAEKIAAHFRLPTSTVENLLKYYSDFNVQEAPKIPEPLADITH